MGELLMARHSFKVLFKDGRTITYEGDTVQNSGYSNIQFTGAFVGFIRADGTDYFNEDEIRSIDYRYSA